MARRMKVALPEGSKQQTPIDQLFNEQNKSAKKEVTVTADSILANSKIVDLKLPENVWIALIERNNQFITPKGNTIILPNDRILLLAEEGNQLQNFEKEYSCKKVIE